MTTLRTGLFTVAVLAVAGRLSAADRTTSRVNELQAAKDRVARAATQTKGGPQHNLLQEQRKLEGLIDDLEHGRSVDAGEIDRALQRAENPGPSW